METQTIPRPCFCDRVPAAGEAFNRNLHCAKCTCYVTGRWPPKRRNGTGIRRLQPKPTKPAAEELPCAFRGEDQLPSGKAFELGLAPEKNWYVCNHPQKPNPATQKGQYVCPCAGCYSGCKGYTKVAEASQEESDVGVVVGTYGLPQLARLQVRMIRETCGLVPILLADDGSNRDAEFEVIASGDRHTTFWPSDHRRGHYAGDLSVFWKGFQWAANRNFKWLCKLSQRFVWTRPGWLKNAVQTLEKSGEATLMQQCTDNGHHNNLFIRSECVLFDVPRWLPYYREFDMGEIHNPTELYLWHRVHQYFGERFCPWPEMSIDRYTPTPGSLWHGSDSEGAFRELARSRGIDLGSEFNTGGWHHQVGWKAG